MPKEPAIQSLTIQNLLSFGDKPEVIELRNLNVLIGPNGSGKSNLIEVIGLLQAAPTDLAKAINKGGPIEEWLWKGATKAPPTASVEVVVHRGDGKTPLRYRLAFGRAASFRFEITDELIAGEQTVARGPYGLSSGISIDDLMRVPMGPQSSILAGLKDPMHYPETTHLGELFSRFRLYRDWEFGTHADVREPCDASLQDDFLEEDGSNLSVVLERLLSQPGVKHQLIESLQTFYHGTRDLRTRHVGSRIETRLEEAGLKEEIPLNRVSDGTVRWLALLAILLNPDPPPLICIEEPELGLHPDMVHEVAKLLTQASQRMQLVVTTHSDLLVEELTEMPEAVLVCEKEGGASHFRRLDSSELSAWLRDYDSLGELWRSGHIGGNRW
jgi:predicted ATPase